jgi:hypothetical protein
MISVSKSCHCAMTAVEVWFCTWTAIAPPSPVAVLSLKVQDSMRKTLLSA